MQNVEDILTTSKRDKWPYPKTFEALEKMGVRSYTVHFIGRYQAVYQGDFGIWQEPIPSGYHPLEVGSVFSQQGIKASIIKHIQEKTSYIAFLTEIAGHGASHYTVDMPKRTVTYFNSDETQFHIENIPSYQ